MTYRDIIEYLKSISSEKYADILKQKFSDKFSFKDIKIERGSDDYKESIKILQKEKVFLVFSRFRRIIHVYWSPVDGVPVIHIYEKDNNRCQGYDLKDIIPIIREFKTKDV